MINAIIKKGILPFTGFNPYFMNQSFMQHFRYAGIYLYQDVNTILEKCPTIGIGLKRYKVAFSCRANPIALDV